MRRHSDPEYRRRFYDALGVDPAELTAAAVYAAHQRLFRRIFEVEQRPGGVFVLKSKKTGAVLSAGFTGKRSAELPLEEHLADPT